MTKERCMTTGMIAVMAIALLAGCGQKDADSNAAMNTAKEPTSSIQGAPTTQPATPVEAMLSEAPASDFQYEEADGKIIIKHYTGESREIAIPAQIDGKDVAVIGDSCFTNQSIVRVVCPDTLETIEETAFANCYDLVEISLNEGLQNIEKHAFLCCKSLECVSIPSTTVFVGELAFSGAGVKELNLLCGSAEWGIASFCDIDIVELTVPSHLKIMGHSMFSNCKSLETVVIEEGVEKIDIQAFGACKNLKKASIPASVTEIGKDAFKSTSADLILTVQPGSYAESYAKDNNIAYVNP